jgi:hypothetical protein
MERDRSEHTDRPSPEEALAALDVVDQANADLAKRLVTPWWYHPILGLIEAMLVLSFAMPIPLRLAVVAVAVAGVGLLVSAYKRLTGLGVSSRYAALARGWVLGLVAIVLAAIGVVVLVDQLVVTVALAVLVLVATVVFGRRADVAIRTRLRLGHTQPVMP